LTAWAVAAIASDGRVYSAKDSAAREFCFGNVLDDLTEQQILESNANSITRKTNKAKAASSNCTHYLLQRRLPVHIFASVQKRTRIVKL